MTSASQKGISVSLLSAATTGTGTAIVVPITNNLSYFVVKGSGTISSGAVSLEEADTDTYSGTWSVIQAITASTLTGNVEQIVHVFGTMPAIRARISTTIGGGGTIDVTFVSN